MGLELDSDLLLFLLWKDEEEISTSPPVSEFVSDAFDSCKINEDDLRKEMEQLVLDKKRDDPNTHQGTSFYSTGLLCNEWSSMSDSTLCFSEETPDWERELQEELQEYDVLDDNENRDDNWDKEIEEMLKEDS